MITGSLLICSAAPQQTSNTAADHHTHVEHQLTAETVKQNAGAEFLSRFFLSAELFSLDFFLPYKRQSPKVPDFKIAKNA